MRWPSRTSSTVPLMRGQDHLTCGEFVEFLACSPDKVAGVPLVVGDEAAVSPVAADEAAAHPGIPGLVRKLEDPPIRSVRAAVLPRLAPPKAAVPFPESVPALPAPPWPPALPGTRGCLGLQALFHYMGLAPHPSPYSAATLPFPLLDAWERLEAVPLRGGYVMSPGLV